MRRYLVVGNETLGGRRLEEEVAARLRRGSPEFHIVVPASPPRGGLTYTEGEAQGLAEDRLERGLRRFAEMGARVEGQVGDGDPFVAIEEALQGQRFDEIILSTLPPGVSKWLKLDLPHLVEELGLPVTHVVAEPEPEVRESALAGVPLFAGLPKRHLRRLARASMVINHRQGEAIVSEGSPGRDLFVLLDGRVRIVQHGRTVASMSAGDVFGEISVLDPGPRTADVIAETPTRSLRLPARSFRAAVEEDARLASRVLASVGRRMRAIAQPPD